MPGSGKSTVGVILAKMTSKSFVDTDILIQTREARTLQDIVDKDGPIVLRQIEEDALLTVKCTCHVIATGGSAAYSHMAMSHLKKEGIVVFHWFNVDSARSIVCDSGVHGLCSGDSESGSRHCFSFWHSSRGWRFWWGDLGSYFRFLTPWDWTDGDTIWSIDS